MDEKNERVAFIQMNQSFDFSGPTKMAKFRVFIYLKMEPKRNKICRNLYAMASGKPRILELTRCSYLYNMRFGKQNYKPVSDICLSLVLS